MRSCRQGHRSSRLSRRQSAAATSRERVLLGRRVDGLLGRIDLAQGKVDPQVLQDVRDLPEQVRNVLKTLGEQFVDPILH